jgi:cytochrome c oxidase subunit 2
MNWIHRPRWLTRATLTAVLPLALVACGQQYPNTTFSPHTEFGRAIDGLWDRLLFWGVLVFVLVELALVFIVVKYRRRDAAPEPEHVHGHTVLEITWTLIPAVILVIIAIPTVKTIMRTEAPAPANALQVKVIGHQWWWEFQYPQYGVTTANELYLPSGRTASFSLTSVDVLHSFWIPQLGGKRDLITNHENHLWFTPDSALGPNAWNGFCAEFCGSSHANMRFRVFTVSAPDFESWAAHQASAAVFAAPPAAAPADSAGRGRRGGAGTNVSAAPQTPAQPAVMPVGYSFPREQLPAYTKPTTPLPKDLVFDATLVGDAERGRAKFAVSACIGCHTIKGTPTAIGTTGPNLTHVGSRTTIGAGLFPNDAQHLRLWVKDAQAMKPGAKMLPMGLGIPDAMTGVKGALTDQQIADIVAYLLALK